MIRIDEAPPGYYWIKIKQGELTYIAYMPNTWRIIRIERNVSGKNIKSYIHFPKEHNYGKTMCTFKYFKEKVGDNYEGLVPIQVPN